MPFFRGRAQGFGQKRDFIHTEGEFIGFGLKKFSFRADVIPKVQPVQKIGLILPKFPFFSIDLKFPGFILNMHKGGFSKSSKPHNSPRDLAGYTQFFKGFLVICFVLIKDLFRVVGYFKALAKGGNPLCFEFFKLFIALLNLIVFKIHKLIPRVKELMSQR